MDFSNDIWKHVFNILLEFANPSSAICAFVNYVRVGDGDARPMASIVKPLENTRPQPAMTPDHKSHNNYKIGWDSSLPKIFVTDRDHAWKGLLFPIPGHVINADDWDTFPVTAP